MIDSFKLEGNFTFTFAYQDPDVEYDDDEEPLLSQYSFAVEVNENYFKNYREDFSNQCAKLESEYGVHDVHASPSDLEGFMSYEVSPKKQLELVTKWRDWYQNNSYNVGEISHKLVN